MKFVVDAHLPPRLVHWLAAQGHEAVHVADLPAGLRTPDQEIWSLAVARGATIWSKDRDFVDLALIRGTPPKLVWVATGNGSASELMDLVVNAWPVLALELQKGDTTVVEFRRTGLIVGRSRR